MEPFIPRAKEFLNFIDNSVSPYHAVENARHLLDKVGFKYLDESNNAEWKLEAGGKYYFTRNQSTIAAFAIGHKFKPGNGFNIVGAHTDSPNLKIKPHSGVESAGLSQVGVELYGGGLWHTWFDRDLTVAGRVLVKNGNNFESRLVKIDKPILRIPTLAIHLDRSVNTDGFKYNSQTHLLPVLSSVVKSQLQGDAAKPDHHPLLLDFIAKQLKVNVGDIQTFDLNLCDTQAGAIGGGLDEFIFSPRLDNLCMSYCSIQSLVDSVSSESFKNESNVYTVFLFDHEEVGSSSAHGAGSPVVLDLVQRVTSINGPNASLVDQAIRKSFLISADMAHAQHPNYAGLHEPLHQPKMNAGPVIKHNANQRYATTAFSAFVIKELAKSNGVPIQEFVVKNDVACGSTIGPIIAALSGIRTVDIGNPQLSMHSIREQCGVADVSHAVKLLSAFFAQFSELDSRIKIDA